MIKYFRAPDIEQRARAMVEALGMGHIDLNRVVFVRSRGSAARRTIARCYAMPRIMQAALDMPAHYIIEVISEKFDAMPAEKQDKTLIHELLHVPKSFGGGFKHHSDFVTAERVEHLYRKFASKRSKSLF